MRPKYVMFSLLGLAVLSTAAVACAQSLPDATPIPSRATATPLAIGRAQVTEFLTPTPTPISPLDREVALDFAVRHRTISLDWERFHADFDQWREGLLACDASAMDRSLGQFAGDFIAITEAARGLPREAAVRPLAGRAVAAAEGEEAAIRLLRDEWAPGDSTAFERVDIQRGVASALRKEVEDRLNDLKVSTASQSRAEVRAFSSKFQQVNADWDEFHQKYDAFRTEEPKLTSLEVVERLSQLVEDFSGIVVAIRELPPSEVTRRVVDSLSQAAEKEDLALRRLRGTFKKETEEPGEETFRSRRGGSRVEVSSEATASGSEEATASEESTAAEEEPKFVARDPTLFDAFDAQLVSSNALRRRADLTLEDVVQATSQDNQEAVAGFSEGYALVVEAWDEFHKEYDEWRVGQGGCDLSKATEVLGEFAIRFAKLAREVRGLPRATFLRPLVELFVEAAEGEEAAVRDLRDTWRPFDSNVYKALDQQRNTARRLRRQVAVGVEDLLDRYDISSLDVESEGSASRK